MEMGDCCLSGKRELVSCQGRGSWFLVRGDGANCLLEEEGVGYLLGKRSWLLVRQEGAGCVLGKRELVTC